MTDVRVMFSGLPGTGKTSYLALVYLAIIGGKAGGIQLATYADDDREFVNEISARLQGHKAAIHTEVEDRGEATLSLTSGDRGVRLSVPDLGGEVWDQALEYRVWSEDLDARIRRAQGHLVFVHATDLEQALTIADAKAARALLNDDDDAEDGARAASRTASGSGSAPEATTWPEDEAEVSNSEGVGDPTEDADSKLPVRRVRQTQVALVDLIQLLVERCPTLPVHLSIVVSAWDRAKKGTKPSAWLRRNCPLLEQFLRVNARTIDARVWGMSAQGGRFDRPAELEHLRELDAVERSICLDADGNSCDPSAPLAWALTLE